MHELDSSAGSVRQWEWTIENVSKKNVVRIELLEKSTWADGHLACQMPQWCLQVGLQGGMGTSRLN